MREGPKRWVSYEVQSVQVQVHRGMIKLILDTRRTRGVVGPLNGIASGMVRTVK